MNGCLSAIFWDPPRAVFPMIIPGLGRPLFWYGLLFALGFFLGYRFFISSLKNRIPPSLAKTIADKSVPYLAFGSLFGARAFDVLFYQTPGEWISRPWVFFTPWEGGLASHGGALGLVVALAVFFRIERKLLSPISFLSVLDCLCLPSAFAAVCIRIGNFFNQEILGTPSTLPFAVIFGHPADGTTPIPRHPVQLYEAVFYLGLGLFLLFCSRLRKTKPGTTFSFFLTSVFLFRFCIEYLKTEQSVSSLTGELLKTGQLLSLPFCILGLFFLLRKQRSLAR